MFRTLLLAILTATVTLPAMAQGGTLHHFRAPATLEQAGHKALWAALLPMDERMQVSVLQDLVKLRTYAQPSVDALKAALDATGLGPFTWEPLTPPVVDPSVFNDFPQYIDTGNPVHDEQVLAAAKAAWFQAHPSALELYLRLVEQGTAPGQHAAPSE